MKFITCLLLILFVQASFAQDKAKPGFAIAIHGGAGNFTAQDIGTDEKLYIAKLTEALATGEEMLSNGDSAVNVVEKVIMILEDSPLFNAGKGAVFTHEGTNELDASIMEGKTLGAGAVAGVRDIKNPICAARKVMEKSGHVLLVGKGASKFAREQGIEIVDTGYFYTKKQWDRLQKMLQKENCLPPEKKGTVGCVALDKYGNLAAGTSTGGMTNKKFGRVGDSPIIGAGTYANNATCAVSCTGHGEYFIRNVVAYDVSALMEYKGWSLKEASEYIVNQKLKKAGGEGGLIAIDKNGQVVMSFNTTGMFRCYLDTYGKKEVLLYK